MKRGAGSLILALAIVFLGNACRGNGAATRDIDASDVEASNSEPADLGERVQDAGLPEDSLAINSATPDTPTWVPSDVRQPDTSAPDIGGLWDARPADASAMDTRPSDLRLPDTAVRPLDTAVRPLDTATPDTGSPDTLAMDARRSDLRLPDTATRVDTGSPDLVPIDAASPDTPPSPGAIGSIEFGRTLWGTDDCVRSDVPAGGTLFSVWTKIPDPGSSYPWTRGNMDVYVLYGENWYFRCLVGNSSASSPTNAAYNANSMLFANPGDEWVNDYSFFLTYTPIAESEVRGWVWVAWQVVVNPDSFTIRQWLKFGLDGEVMAAGESQPTFAEIRTALVTLRGWTQTRADAWIPGKATNFQVGKDNGYLCHARMGATNVTPTLAALDAIARANAPDTTAWADYKLNWENGAPNLSDQSGHGRNLAVEAGGTLYQGPASPTF